MALNTLQMHVTRTPDWSWHFVDHERKILTMGFRSHPKLMKYRNSFSTGPLAIKLMQERYRQVYGTGA